MSDDGTESLKALGINNEPQGSGQELRDAIFVGWTPESDDSPRKTGPRLYHKKSRLGCQQCRARRVKCDEVHPICGSCYKHESTCIWGRQQPYTKSESSESKAPEIRSKPKQKNPERTEAPESSERRMLELRLLHQYMAYTCWTLNSLDDPLVQEWNIYMPQLALGHKALLYSIMTVSALHLSRLEPNIQEHMNTYQRYLDLALREHRIEVASLSSSNADSACCTSNFIRVCAFAILQERNLEMYEPPIAWLQTVNGTGKVFPAACEFLENSKDSVTMRMVGYSTGTELLLDAQDKVRLFRPENRKSLDNLLQRCTHDETTEPWDEDIRIVYENMISYIGAIRLAISEGEAENSIFRRLLMFPMVCEQRFVDLVAEGRPRALVVLAYYFALLHGFKGIWWIGEIGVREVEGIAGVLEEERKWAVVMEWPLSVVRG